MKPLKDHQYFPSIIQIEEAKINLVIDNGYLSEASKERDIAWRAFQKGLVYHSEKSGIKIWSDTKLPVADEYHFVKKYFSPFWVYYIFFIRIVCLKNPVNEVIGLLKSLKIKRENIYSTPVINKVNRQEDTVLIERQSLVSVIIPTLNRYEYLKDVLDDLTNQTYKNFEVIVIDQSEPFNSNFYNGWNLRITVRNQKEKALWLARNSAIRMSKGGLILLFDDDSRVNPDWIEQHMNCLGNYDADLSSGISLSKVGDKIPENYNFFRWSDQVDTGNVMVKKAVFEKIGLFDRQFEKQRMGDGEFGLRAYLAGFRNISNPLAKRIHLKVDSGGLRQMGSWDAFRPKKILAPRPIPSVLYLFRKYYGGRAAIYTLIQNTPLSIIPYKYKGSSKMKVLGIVSSFLLSPFLLLQIIISWRMSGKMLKQGDKIEWL